MTSTEPLHKQLTANAFALAQVSVAQDISTIPYAHVLEAAFGGPDAMAARVGLSSHPAMTAAQIMKTREVHPDAWRVTSRVTMASALLCSIFLGKVAPHTVAEVSGSGLWNPVQGAWDDQVLELVAASHEGGKRLKEMLGPVEFFSGQNLGQISPYFVQRYGFDKGLYIQGFTFVEITDVFCLQTPSYFHLLPIISLPIFPSVLHPTMSFFPLVIKMRF